MHVPNDGPGTPGDTPGYVEDPELAALKVAYPGWLIGPAPFHGLRATWRSESGVQIHHVYGTSVADLHRRLEVIESARGESE